MKSDLKRLDFSNDMRQHYVGLQIESSSILQPIYFFC